MVAVLHIDVVIVSLVNNTTPVFVCLLAMCFLKEKLRGVEVFFMSLTFACVIIIIMGAGESGDGSTFKDAPWAYLALFINPLLSAAG
jgi:drug/metabolite transporter (DMT)-like permease